MQAAQGQVDTARAALYSANDKADVWKGTSSGAEKMATGALSVETRGLCGGVEAGGTKFVCMIASGPDDIRAETSFPTTAPLQTISLAVDFFRQNMPIEDLAAIGVGSFGPVDPDPASPFYGYITSTPKPGWAQTNIVGMLREPLGIPVAFDTDVNCAAYGEYRWGAGRETDPIIYITVGTGIGGGVIFAGNPAHGLVHPEIGHMLIPHDREMDPFQGSCPFHRDCLEGLASGNSLRARWGQLAQSLPDDHPAWEKEAHYLALALANLVLIISPRRIILGGGVMERQGLLTRVREKLPGFLSGYIQSSHLGEGISRYVVLPGLGNRAGVLGAIALAQDYLARL